VGHFGLVLGSFWRDFGLLLRHFWRVFGLVMACFGVILA
jgi:hypothetical protein